MPGGLDMVMNEALQVLNETEERLEEISLEAEETAFRINKACDEAIRRFQDRVDKLITDKERKALRICLLI
jgi:ElaB/YqjD/DUF883 family membrane-anchored ribosome-binding protein